MVYFLLNNNTLNHHKGSQHVGEDERRPQTNRDEYNQTRPDLFIPLTIEAQKKTPHLSLRERKVQRLTQLTDSPPPPAADLFLLFFTSALRQRNAAQHQRVKEKRAEYNQNPRVERVAAAEFQKADC